MHIGGKNFTNFENVRLSRTGTGVSEIRFIDASGSEGTLNVPAAIEAARAWSLPNKSGTLSISGTAAVQLPAVAATTYVYNTIVTTTGVRVGDAITCTVMQNLVTSARILIGATPGADQVTLSFVNLGVATAYGEFTIGYTASRV